MNRGIIFGLISAMALPAAAHVSHADGAAHAAEHMWLLLLLVPALLLGRPLARRLIRNKKP